jgi:hypothetical protein
VHSFRARPVCPHEGFRMAADALEQLLEEHDKGGR